VFEALFAAAGADFAAAVPTRPAQCLARHAWAPNQQLDLYADLEQTVAAIAAFAGAGEAAGYRDFCRRAGKIYGTLKDSFIAAPRTNPVGLSLRIGPGHLGDLMGISPFARLWPALGKHFRDPRLQQLFGRYATYCGASPFLAPATLMLVAHVEREGVWLVEGGMQRLAEGLQKLAIACGARFRFNAEVAEVALERGRVSGLRLADGKHLAVDAVIANCDVNAVAQGLLGDAVRPAAQPVARAERSLSAVTWAMAARTEGFPLSHHTVFFADDYAAEFDAIFRARRLPEQPTVYICAQDRGADDTMHSHEGPERLFLLVNAPADGDTRTFTTEEIAACASRTLAQLKRCGLTITPTAPPVATTPADFARRFPATGGALYGRASHGWAASFKRPGGRTQIPGLYLAGGSAHPGPGLPMAALSGRIAAESLIADSASIRSFHRMAMSGGTSTHSAPTTAKR
jgi:1-hydroxycarotenoid 3,4-desaturase